MTKPAYRNFFSMGTRLDVILPGIEDEFADQVIGDIKNELDNLEKTLGYFDFTSIVQYHRMESDNLNESHPRISNKGFSNCVEEGVNHMQV